MPERVAACYETPFVSPESWRKGFADAVQGIVKGRGATIA